MTTTRNVAPTTRGPCITCEAPDSALHMHLPSLGGFTGPYCNSCSAPLWARQKAEWAAIRAEHRAKAQAEGIAFWAARGLKPGDAVTVFGMSLYGRFPIAGIACVDGTGAFVRSPRYGRKKLDASGAVPRLQAKEAA